MVRREFLFEELRPRACANGLSSDSVEESNSPVERVHRAVYPLHANELEAYVRPGVKTVWNFPTSSNALARAELFCPRPPSS